MVLNIAADVSSRVSDAMTETRSGDAKTAAENLKVLLRDLGSAPTQSRLTAEYALAIASSASGESEQAFRAAEACLTVADSLDEPGWVATARALRAELLTDAGRTLEAIDDLVRAEYELGRCVDPPLTALAHSGLGNAYEAFRMFEQAVPHYEAALGSGATMMAVSPPSCVAACDLASITRLWAREVIILGDPARDGEVTMLLEQARDWSERAIELARSTPEDTRHAEIARFHQVCGAWREDPRDWLEALHEVRAHADDSGLRMHALEATASLALAYAQVGDLAAARRESTRAMKALDHGSDPNLERYVRWADLSVASAEGQGAADRGLELAAAITRGWWAQHESDVQIMRSAITAHARARSVERDVRAAREDPLTGLGNRRALDERMAAATAEQAEIGLICIDIDGLKRLNDTLGHNVGDRALSAVAGVISKNIRMNDLAIRFGGDEFLIVLDRPGVDDAELVVDRLQVAIRLAGLTETHSYLRGVGLSVGIASTAEGLRLEELLEVSDRRMYADKRRRLQTHSAIA